jgi:regulation of enolase protein 1 (concanavalin A-like superfamily)
MILNYLVWRFQFYAFVQDKTTFFTKYLLRQDLTAEAEVKYNQSKLFMYYDK